MFANSSLTLFLEQCEYTETCNEMHDWHLNFCFGEVLMNGQVCGL